MFFRLSTERADLVTIRDLGCMEEVTDVLAGYSLTVDAAVLEAELTKGPWSIVVPEGGAEVMLSVSTVARRTP